MTHVVSADNLSHRCHLLPDAGVAIDSALAKARLQANAQAFRAPSHKQTPD